ncbi:MAG TPA: hypothetical protein VNB22_04675 [Pyrinomonadaceae bacterium]|jgi:hypothetical protein|nr:hypothetical protein [Pyrinomonadaceae bacterium]
MPFENFYKASDEARRRWWKCFGLAFLLFTGYWAFALSALPEVEVDRDAAEYLITEAFNKTERVRRADDLCRYLPLPEQFFFTTKDLPQSYPNSTSVVYHYRSDRQPEEITPFFLMWFNSNGWKNIGNGSMFRKDNQIVTIGISKPFDVMTGYEIRCTETE